MNDVEIVDKIKNEFRPRRTIRMLVYYENRYYFQFNDDMELRGFEYIRYYDLADQKFHYLNMLENVDLCKDIINNFREIDPNGFVEEVGCYKNYANITCGNCGGTLQEKDKYCRFCGTRKGEGTYQADPTFLNMLYGPPVKKRYRCEKCNCTYNILAAGRQKPDYCPECGTKAKLIWSKNGSWDEEEMFEDIK